MWRAWAEPLLRDPPVPRLGLAGLAHLGVEPDIADQLLGRLEAVDVADHRHEGGGRDEAHPGHRHQPLDLLRRERQPGEL
jgi:hypothetical protein